jgi:diazepam-binding inhibitor (GABA receptor modulating acyl-CoA-binding protein)
MGQSVSRFRKEAIMSDSDLQARFDAAAQDAQQLPRRPGNATLLKLYAYYKQGTVGDAPGNRPGLGDFAGRAKYDAWVKVQGMSQEDAMQAYIDLVERLKAT